MATKGKLILNQKRLSLTMLRLVQQLVEEFDDFANTCIIGIQPRGTAVADRLMQQLSTLHPTHKALFGKLDITFYRDDFRMREEPLVPSSNDIPFSIDDKRVLLVDDVLYTGRTISAAINALQQYGRAADLKLLTLVDRRFNRHLPVRPDFFGTRVDALDESYVRVTLSSLGSDTKDEVRLFPSKS